MREQQALPLRDATQPMAPPRLRIRPRHLAVSAVTILAAVLNIAGLQDEGYANTYYAAAVKSMLLNWHNFLFVSFDPGGFVAVDKPPLGLWLQVGSAKLLGYSGVSMLLPQAIAGVLAVLLLYHLVARVFGVPAGLLAALFLAISPIAVVDSRNNTPDSVLVLLALLAVWAVLRAVDAGCPGSGRSSLRWLLLSAVFVGLAFNVKELEAYLVVPALVLVYAFGAPASWLRRLWHLLLAGVVLLAVSFAWIIAVDLTPASQRPYVSDSGSNSELSLALGYNGFGRLAAGIASHVQLPFLHINLDFSIVPAISFEIGNPGILRLVEPQVGGQASWLLPLAVIGLIAAASQLRGRITVRREFLNLLLWGTLLATLAVFFSVARFYHLYYLTILAAPVAALAGLGAVALWRDYRQGVAGGRWWQGWALPLALPLTALAQANILAGYASWNGWLGPALVAAAVVAAIILIAGRLHVQVLLSPEVLLRLNARVLFAASALGILSLLAAPAAFAEISVANGNGSGWLVQAGPPADTNGFGGRFGLTGRAPGFFAFGGSGGSGQARHIRFRFPGTGSGATPPAGGPSGAPPGGGFGFGRGGFGGFGGGAGTLTFAGSQIPAIDPGLLRYLEAHRGGSRYLVGTMTSSYASLFIIDTGQPVMDLGGYQGWDRILTPAQLARLVRDGSIRYFLISGFGGGGFGGRGGFGGAFGSSLPAGVNANVDTVNDDLSAWITAHCTAIPATAYSSSSSSGGAFGLRDAGPGTLYDCEPT